MSKFQLIRRHDLLVTLALDILKDHCPQYFMAADDRLKRVLLRLPGLILLLTAIPPVYGIVHSLPAGQ